jgi:transcription antitermination factor NusG
MPENEAETDWAVSARCGWFALYVKPRHEKNVATMLRFRGYREFTPLYRRSQSGRHLHLPLFPSYVFCQFDPEDRFPVVSIPGVFFVVRNGAALAPVAPEELLRIRQLVASDLNIAPTEYPTTGREVKLTAGPLRGLDGIVQERESSTHLIVSVTLLQRSVKVKIDPGWITQ